MRKEEGTVKAPCKWIRRLFAAAGFSLRQPKWHVTKWNFHFFAVMHDGGWLMQTRELVKALTPATLRTTTFPINFQ